MQEQALNRNRELSNEKKIEYEEEYVKDGHRNMSKYTKIIVRKKKFIVFSFV